jgi:tetratricopeptide (TPR) repeat protein
MMTYVALDFGWWRFGEFHIEQALRLNRDSAENYYLAGRIALRLRGRQKALVYFDRALRLNPDHLHARYERVNLLRQLRRDEDALKDTQWLIDHKQAEMAKAGTLFWYGRRMPFEAVMKLHHASILGMLGRPDEGEAIVNRVIESGASAVMLNARAEFLMSLPVGLGHPSRMKDAVIDAERATDLDPDYLRAWQTYAKALQYLRRHDEALAAIDRALVLSPVDSGLVDMLWLRSRMLQDLKRKSESVEVGLMAFGVAFRTEPSLVQLLLARISSHGYWQEGRSANGPSDELRDAITACRSDPQCW